MFWLPYSLCNFPVVFVIKVAHKLTLDMLPIVSLDCYFTCNVFNFLLDQYLLQPIQRQSTILTQGLERALSTGNWDLKRFRMHRKGVSQVVDSS